MALEERLTGGNLSGEIVRIGDTVRRPVGPWTPAVHRLLRHLEAFGFAGAPRVLGIDELGREVLEHIPGEVAWGDDHHRLLGTGEAVAAAGRLLRSLHDAVTTYVPPVDSVWRYPDMAADAAAFGGGGPIIICHNDPAAWNLVVGPDRWAFIDWDAAGPRPALWDLASCAIGVLPISPDGSAGGWSGPVPTVDRLVALADGYGLTAQQRDQLPDVIVARILSSYTHMQRRAGAGIAPWDRLWNEGHGRAWAEMHAFAQTQTDTWRGALT